jgi:hypothetical protein
MRIISHRGNLHGPVYKDENKPSVVEAAWAAGFDVEIDFWRYKNRFWLGHDNPQYNVSFSWINHYGHIYNDNHLWIHCKNLDAIEYLINRNNQHLAFFWHQTDNFTLTSNNKIWTFPNKEVCNNTVLVDKNLFHDYNITPHKNIFGVCTDYPVKLKEHTSNV